MIEITRKLEFDSGHRVLGHESKCAHLHGHRYTVELTVTAPELDSLGRVIDFSCLKSLVGAWVDDNLDHNMLLHPDDPLLFVCDDHTKAGDVFGQKRPFVMPPGQNPTAENIARVIYEAAAKMLPQPIAVVAVKLWETPNCFAVYRQ